MIRGTTPTFELTIESKEIDLTQMTNVYATFEQNGCKLTKTGNDIDVSAQQVDVYLSQAETLKFAKGDIHVQLNWTFNDGHRACSEIAMVKIGDNLEDRVLQ